MTPLIALASCATPDASSRTEFLELKAQLRAIREENARLSRRVERLELTQASSAAPRPAVAASEPPSQIPSLTVVKLKPKVEPAPKVDTQVAVVEPSADLVEQLSSSAANAAKEEELDPQVGDQLFEAGVSALKTGNVVGGIERLRNFASENPRHPKADNALYFAAIGLMGLNDYEDAARGLQDVVATYPAGDAVMDSLLKLAECRVRLNQPTDARAIYLKLVASYPGTSAASLAQDRLKLERE